MTEAMKILIVDDEPHLRMLIQQTLEELEDEGVELLVAPMAKRRSTRSARSIRGLSSSM